MKKLSLVLYTALVFATLACNNLVDGINDDPNSPTEAPSSNILTGAQVALIQVVEGDIARKAGMWSGYYKGEAQQYEGFYNYLSTAGDFSSNWEDVYSNVVRNSIITQQVAETEGNTGVITGIAEVVKAIGLGTATSLWGNVPFTEAGDYHNFPTPVYEEQLAIYDSLQNMLNQAILTLSATVGRPGARADIFFDGDPDSWIKVAYTLKARYYMQTKDYSNAYNAALLGINNEAGSMLALHDDAEGVENLYFQFFSGNRNEDLSSNGTTIVNILNPSSASYRGNAKTNEATRFGFLFVSAGAVAVPNTGGIFADVASFPIVSYQENILTLAEAGARSQNFVTGLVHLNAFRNYLSNGGYIGNTTLQYDAYIEADFNSGGMENQEGITADDALIREIVEERYITFFGQIAGYIDVRRTLNESTVRVPVLPNTGVQFPERFLYPQSEVERNPNTPNPIPGMFEATAISN